MSRYLVTGAAGFIASKVCDLLLSQGHAVVGLDNLNDAYDTRLKRWRLEQLQGRSGFDFRQLDICDQKALGMVFEPRQSRFDAVINLAARAGVRQSVENPWVYVDTNMTGTLNLLDCTRKIGIERFVLASTSSLYGAVNPLPFSEEADTDFPLSPYAASKKGAEALCHSYHHLHGMQVTVLRYFTVYGPAGRPDMSLFRFVQWISEERPVTVFGDGTQKRDFSYVEDIARGTIAAAQSPIGSPDRQGYEVINLGSDRPVILRDAIQLVEDLVHKKAHIEYRPMHRSDVPATWADVRKAGRILNWQPRMSFEGGVKALVDWYVANRLWAKDIRTD
jgi:UDP-glucuronate 4-epimerase